MKVDYAIELLKIDLKHEVQGIWSLRHKVHKTMLVGLLEIAHEIRNAIKILEAQAESPRVRENEKLKEDCEKEIHEAYIDVVGEYINKNKRTTIL